MISRPKAAIIVAAIVALGRALGLSLVAEGTETDDQLRALEKVGCELVQGYLLGQPQAAESIISLLAAQQQPSPDRSVLISGRPRPALRLCITTKENSVVAPLVAISDHSLAIDPGAFGDSKIKRCTNRIQPRLR